MIQVSLIRTDVQIRQIEADNIRAALKAANGKVSGPGGAAQLLGMKPTTLASRIRALEVVLSNNRSPNSAAAAGVSPSGAGMQRFGRIFRTVRS